MPKTPTDRLSDNEKTADIEIPPPAGAASNRVNARQIPVTGQTAVLRASAELGALDTFLTDPTISEIMVNDLRNVMIEREGKLQFSGFKFQSIDELNRVVRSLCESAGRYLTAEQPYLDLSLPDGSRVHLIGPPVTMGATCITIRKFPHKRFVMQDLLAHSSLDQKMAYFLNVCVMGRLNILVSGGTGSGKTTLLNVLASFIPKSERIITIEDTPELSIQQSNSVRLVTKPASPTSPALTAREMLANSLRMRPDRIIVGEVRRGEALDMLQAMNTGHDGSLSTIHANTYRDAISRLETLCLMSGINLPLLAIRKQIASSIDLIVQTKRLRSGERKITTIAELTGMEGEVITSQELFGFDETKGFKSTGLVPAFAERLKEQSIEFPSNFWI